MNTLSSRSLRQLFVEGHDDKWVIINLLFNLRPSWNRDARTWGGGFEIKDFGSDGQALDAFVIAAKGGEAGRIGLVLDADNQTGKRISDRWAQISKKLQRYAQNMPAQPASAGWIGATPRGLRVGVWLMPNNAIEGGLEAFITRFVPSGDTAWLYALDVVRAAKSQYNVPYPSHHEAKARLHTWLAWREEAGRPYGRAIKCGDLVATNDPNANLFAIWFESLFIT